MFSSAPGHQRWRVPGQGGSISDEEWLRRDSASGGGLEHSGQTGQDSFIDFDWERAEGGEEREKHRSMVMVTVVRKAT